MLRATRIAEEQGIRAVAVVAQGFMAQARATASAMGAKGLFLATYPGVVPIDSHETFADKIWSSVLPSVLDSMQREAPALSASVSEPSVHEIVVSGSLADVQEYFDAREWSDGLPIVPPTRELVGEFLKWTTRNPGEVIGVLPAEFREATVWSVAVNGVMAGCRPEYMPILLAAVDAIAAPEFRLADAGSTPSWEPLVLVSGEIARRLKFNTEAGNMKVGRRANASIGRFLRLYLRNVAGFHPGTTDKGSIGYTFNVAMAENEEAVRSLGWEPVRRDLGYAMDDNVVMVQSVVGISVPIYHGGNDGKTLAWPLLQYMTGTAGPYGYTPFVYGQWHPLILMSPAVARGFVDAGWGKADIRRYLFENCKVEARMLEYYQMHVAGQEVSFVEMVQRGSAPASYAAFSGSNEKVPALLREECTRIVVGGDPGRNQSKIYLNNHEQGPPVSRRIALPADWRERIS